MCLKIKILVKTILKIIKTFQQKFNEIYQSL